jgi:hypothetical protein
MKRELNIALAVILVSAAYAITGRKNMPPAGSDFRDAVRDAASPMSSLEAAAIGAEMPEAAAVPLPQTPVPAEAAREKTEASEGGEYEWLVMVFINGRNNLWEYAVADLNEMEGVGSTGKVAVVAEVGLFPEHRDVTMRGSGDEKVSFNFYKDLWKVCKESKYCLYPHDSSDPRPERINTVRYLIQKDAVNPSENDYDFSHVISKPLEVSRKVDMGDWRQAADFAAWAASRFKAKKYMLILWNHGAGKEGISFDDLSGSKMSLSDMKKVLASTVSNIGKKVDIYISDACLMQMAEVVYELKDQAGIIVGSQAIVPETGIPYNTMLRRLNSQADASAGKAAIGVAEEFNEYYRLNPKIGKTMQHDEVGDYYVATTRNTTISAIKTDRMQEFTHLLNKWVSYALRDQVLRKELQGIIDNTLRYTWDEKVSSRDLYQFLDLVNRVVDKESSLYAVGEKLKKLIDGGLVISNSTTGSTNPSLRENSHGLAIYLPSESEYSPSYLDTEFARQTAWDKFLFEIVKDNLLKTEKE